MTRRPQVRSMAGVRRQLAPCRAGPSPTSAGTDAMSWMAASERPTSILGFKPGAFAAVVPAAAATVAGLVVVMGSTGLPEHFEEPTVGNGSAFHLRFDVSDGEVPPP